MSTLFENPTLEVSETKRSLPGATMVKTKAMTMASQIMAKIPQADADYLNAIKASQESTAAMDDLVKQECGDALNDSDVAQFDPEEAQKILKSNQSNRSRRKNMPMTQSNYVEMLTAAIAEWIIRTSCNMQKSAVGFGGHRHAVEITPEVVSELANDQEALGKAIRNIQSKKSTYKAKNADRDYEQDGEWLKLLEQEALLKAARTTVPAGRKGVSIKKALQFVFDGVEDVESLGKDDSHRLLKACYDLSRGTYPQEFMDMVNAEQAQKAAEAVAEKLDDDIDADIAATVAAEAVEDVYSE